MRSLLSLFVFICAFPCFGQITAVQQKALNSYVDYANHSADEMASVVSSIIEYYPTYYSTINSQKKSWRTPRYVCPIQLNDYYLDVANTQSKNLGAAISTPLNSKLKELDAVARKIETTSKALDTYHKLEDYKQDNFVKAGGLINELQVLVVE